jgi:hypothetical protein
VVKEIAFILCINLKKRYIIPKLHGASVGMFDMRSFVISELVIEEKKAGCCA